jgi:hypothetical protein
MVLDEDVIILLLLPPGATPQIQVWGGVLTTEGCLRFLRINFSCSGCYDRY